MAVKLALVIRADLGMGRGKIAAQAAHAAVVATLATLGGTDSEAWLAEGQPKVVLKAVSPTQLDDIVSRALSESLPVQVVHDAGRTQVTAGTLTCCAIGPAQAERIDLVTADLSLL